MNPEPTATTARLEPAMPPAGEHQHISACFWHVDECRWRCVTSHESATPSGTGPAVRRLVEHSASEISP